MTIKPLSNYLRMHRKHAGLSQREMARLLGCADGAVVSRYETGKYCPSLDVLLAYRIIFEYPMRDLFLGEFERVSTDVRQRAKVLMRELDEKPDTALVRRKFDFLVDVAHPEKLSRS